MVDAVWNCLDAHTLEIQEVQLEHGVLAATMQAANSRALQNQEDISLNFHCD